MSPRKMNEHASEENWIAPVFFLTRVSELFLARIKLFRK